VIAFDAWLHDVTTKPLPGGVSAAALASAMGAALVAKAAQVSLQRQDMKEEVRTACKAILDLARDQQQTLLGLAEADERACRAVLESHAHEHGTPSRDNTWHDATEVPICVAEACHLLLRRLPELLDLCWPALQPDLQVGRWLLETGVRAGLSVAETNLSTWGDASLAESLRLRLGALK
jgi:formiminotetrahydrofolate cyclodeaminase